MRDSAKMQKIPKQIINAKTGTALFVLCWFAYFITYFGRLNYNATMAQLLAENVLTKPLAGSIGTAFFLSYAIGQLISGYLGDKLPPKWFVFAGLSLSGLCNLLMGAARAYPLMLAIWSVNGLVQSFIWAPLLRILCERYTDVPRRRACIQINTSVPAGTFLTYALCAALVGAGLWRSSFTVSGALLLVFSVVWVFALSAIEKHTEQNGILPPEMPKATQKNANASSGKFFMSLFFGAGFCFLCAALAVQGMLKDGVTSWSPVYLTETYGLGTAAAILSTTVLPILNLFGAVLASFANKRCKGSEMKAAMLLFAACGAGLLALFLLGTRSALAALCLLAIATTAMMAVNILLISLLPTRFSASGRVATVSGVLNFTVYLGTAFSNYGIGEMALRFGWSITILVWALFAFTACGLCALALTRWNQYNKKGKA